jgi:hypothetical protein
MLLVDGNIRSTSLATITPMSLFCANFILSMEHSESENVFTHFYCGLHTFPDDMWHGPNGLVRSIIIQLLLILGERGLLSLDFLNYRTYVKELECHNLSRLCEVLQDFVRQFPPDTTIFCVIDGLSNYDIDGGGVFDDLELVVRYLTTIVEDDELRPKFKVLMTVPGISTLRLKELVNESYRISLTSSSLNPRLLSQQSVEVALSRPMTPLIDR